MSLTISRSEEVTVYTINSNRKSKWPLFCLILGTMCYSPVCSVSQRLKQQLGCALTALATVQIMVGIMNVGFGSVSAAVYYFSNGPVPFCLGGTTIAAGIMCILAEKFPSPCLVVLTVLMNIVSAGIAIANIVLSSVNLAQISFRQLCEFPKRQTRYPGYWTTPSPSKIAEWDKLYERQLEDYRACEQNKLILKTILGGICIMMIVLALLQLSVAISWCVLSIKALRKKKADEQDIDDPELHKPLMEQETTNIVC